MRIEKPSSLTGRLARLLPVAAWTLALALCAWVAAELVLRLITPAPVHSLPAALPPPAAAAEEIAASALLGGAAASPPATSTPPAGNTAYRLLGVATGFGHGPAFAILQPTTGAARAVLEGDSLSPGETLRRVHADRVDIERAGILSTVTLERGARSGAIAPPSPDHED